MDKLDVTVDFEAWFSLACCSKIIFLLCKTMRSRDACSMQWLYAASASVEPCIQVICFIFELSEDWLSPLLSWLNRAVPEDAIDLGVKWQDVKEQAGRP